LTQPTARPLGITILAILAIIAGILLVFGGLSLLTLGAFFAAFPAGNMISEQQQQQQFQLDIQNQAELENLSQFLGSIGIIIGAIVLAVGIGYLVVSLWSTKRNGLGMDYCSNFNNHSNSNPNYLCCISKFG
jgi:uncharacterized protein (DUF2062 family)